MITNFTSLPREIKKTILDSIEPEEKTPESIQLCARRTCALVSLFPKREKSILDAKLKELFSEFTKAQEEIEQLNLKYNVYNSAHKYFMEKRNKIMALPRPYTHSPHNNLLSPFEQTRTKILITYYLPERVPTLLSAISSGYNLPLLYRAGEAYTPEVGQDIKRIIDLMPKSIHCRESDSLDNHAISVLHQACANDAIPIPIIDLLLQKGANPNDFLYFYAENRKTKIISEINRSINTPGTLPFQPFGHLSQARLEALRDLFIKYGAVDDAAHDE